MIHRGFPKITIYRGFPEADEMALDYQNKSHEIVK